MVTYSLCTGGQQFYICPIEYAGIKSSISPLRKGWREGGNSFFCFQREDPKTLNCRECNKLLTTEISPWHWKHWKTSNNITHFSNCCKATELHWNQLSAMFGRNWEKQETFFHMQRQFFFVETLRLINDYWPTFSFYITRQKKSIKSFALCFFWLKFYFVAKYMEYLTYVG